MKNKNLWFKKEEGLITDAKSKKQGAVASYSEMT